MLLWDQLVTTVRDAIFAYAQLTHGSLGTGILVVSVGIRLLLLPLGVKLGVLAARHQAVMARLKPELDALRERLAHDPTALYQQMKAVMAREGVTAGSTFAFLGAIGQVPVFLALFTAVQQTVSKGGAFLWVRDLARPDAFVGVAATALAALAAFAGPQPGADHRWLLVAVTTVVSLIALSQMSAGVGLYWGASSAVGVVQSVLIKKVSSRRP